jgi:hypothetical protein
MHVADGVNPHAFRQTRLRSRLGIGAGEHFLDTCENHLAAIACLPPDGGDRTVAYTQGAMPVQPTLAHLPKTGSTLPAMTRADQSSTADTAWRADIDGLRAIAVIALILFHAGFEFIPGGFTGVDIFFVVSGFLIGRQIITELDSHKFSFAQFWFRRARRILPALIVMIAASLAAGWLILMPNDLKDTGRAALAQSVFASNIYFWLKGRLFRHAFPAQTLAAHLDPVARRAILSVRTHPASSTAPAWPLVAHHGHRRCAAGLVLRICGTEPAHACCILLSVAVQGMGAARRGASCCKRQPDECPA